MSNKTILQNEKTDREEAVSRFKDLFDTANVVVEKIEYLLYLYYTVVDEHFELNSRDKEQAQQILTEHNRYNAYLNTANDALCSIMQELKKQAEKTAEYYPKL